MLRKTSIIGVGMPSISSFLLPHHITISIVVSSRADGLDVEKQEPIFVPASVVGMPLSK